MAKRVAVAFTGPSNSGKTTLVAKLSKKLIPTRKVAIIKNDPKDKAHFDVEGKDSYKFSQTGAETVVVSPTRTTYFSQRHKDLDQLVSMIDDFDILFVEGLKTLPLPRIAICREEIQDDYLDYSEAIAVDKSIDISTYNIPSHISILPLEDLDAIVAWIDKNAKEV
ncbi:MAG: molybdopterin-guanine dinucleotide biosynthesis protein B [Campylobacterota bacterium]